MAHKLPPLPYEYSALEPYIDTRTMAVHHDKHHQAYVDNLNKVLADYPDLQNKSTLEMLSDLDSVPEKIRTAVRNHGGGHLNHTMFWNSLRPAGGTEPAGSMLAEAMRESFSSFQEFQAAFTSAATTLFGSGWTWLCVDSESKLQITTTANQDNPVSQGLIPLVGLDVWEHAYYLKYENRRAEYITSWWNVVSWKYVSSNFSTAKVALGARDVAEDVTKWAEDTWSKIEDVFSKSEDE
jgi:Fe-Mn family superoxide dismutase